MKSVFVVERGDYSDRHVIAVCKDEDIAKRFEELYAHSYNNAYYTEWRITTEDDLSETHEPGKIPKTGYIYRAEIILDDMDIRILLDDYGGKPHATFNISPDKIEWLMILGIWANNTEQAEKMASDKLKELIESGEMAKMKEEYFATRNLLRKLIR